MCFCLYSSCAGGTGGPLTPCDEGTYNPDTGQSTDVACQNCAANATSAAGSTACTPCPAGYSCSQPNTKTACNAQEYSLEGEMSCTACTTGYICPTATVAPQVIKFE